MSVVSCRFLNSITINDLLAVSLISPQQVPNNYNYGETCVMDSGHQLLLLAATADAADVNGAAPAPLQQQPAGGGKEPS